MKKRAKAKKPRGWYVYGDSNGSAGTYVRFVDGAESARAKKSVKRKPVSVKIHKGGTPEVDFIVDIACGGKTVTANALDVVRQIAACALMDGSGLHHAVVRATGGQS